MEAHEYTSLVLSLCPWFTIHALARNQARTEQEYARMIVSSNACGPCPCQGFRDSCLIRTSLDGAGVCVRSSRHFIKRFGRHSFIFVNDFVKLTSEPCSSSICGRSCVRSVTCSHQEVPLCIVILQPDWIMRSDLLSARGRRESEGLLVMLHGFMTEALLFANAQHSRSDAIHRLCLRCVLPVVFYGGGRGWHHF